MPEFDPTTPRFSSDGPVVRFATAGRFLPYAVTYAFPWATESKADGFWDSPESAARRIADALNECVRHPWDDNLTAEEAGAETILVWDSYGWNPAVWQGDPACWWWRDSGEPVRGRTDRRPGGASCWRPMPKAPTDEGGGCHG